MGKHTKGRATFIGANGGVVGFYSFEFDDDGYHSTHAPPGTVACNMTCEQGYLAEMTHDKDGGAFVFRAIELPDEPIMPAARARLYATSTPRWSRWHESWAARRTVVRHIVEEHQPSWLALPTCLALDDGRLTWFYRRGCEFGGRFTVPYLCDESDLVARICTHRPGDYADKNGNSAPGYVPGYWGDR